MLNESSIVTAIGSFQNSLGSLTISAKYNLITTLPPYMIDTAGAGLNIGGPFGASITLKLGFNPITYASPLVFASSQYVSGAQISTLVLDISNATTLGPLPNGTVFNFQNTSFGRESALAFMADYTGLGLSLVSALQNFSGSNLSVSIAGNNISMVPSGSFSLLSESLTSIDLSNNALSDASIQELAFQYNFLLTSLDLSGNNLSWLPARLTEALPALQRLNLGGNPIMALPTFSNHVDQNAPQTTKGNVLQCTEYGPLLTNTTCNCTQGLFLSIHCGCVPPLHPLPIIVTEVSMVITWHVYGC
jgi:Leucine-rich repeat (LRR) protein